MNERTPERLTRLLSLVSHLSEAGEVSISDLANHFGVTAVQIAKDINTLWVSGTPGYLADDLIDFDYDSFESGTIKLTQNRGLDRPLRLGAREAMSLIASLNALRELVGSVESSTENVEVVSTLIDRLSAFLGHSANALDVKLNLAGTPAVLGSIQRAIAAQVCAEIDYVTADDRRTTRIIEPFEVINDGDYFYVVAFCLSAQQDRIFRLDRIGTVTVLEDTPATHVQPSGHAPIVPRSQSKVTLVLLPGGQWLAEQLPNQGMTHNSDGSITVVLEVANEQWLNTTLLQYATLIKSVSPVQPAEIAAAQAAATLEKYRELQES